MRLTRMTVAAVLLAASVGMATVTAAQPPEGSPAKRRARTTSIQILALNDFHGQLEVVDPLVSSAGRIGPSSSFVPAGGAEYLATHVRNLRAENRNTLFVSAGDLIGATPLLSALFHDEPTIEAFNLMDLDYNGVGNHEFDEGIDELLRMQYGSQLGGDGCHPVDGCGDGDPFAGAEFEFLAANVVYRDSGETIFPPYAIHHVQGVKVGIIGMTLEGTPEIVTPAGIATVDFLDEAQTVNALIPELKKRNVETIIVLLHEGGTTSIAGNGAGGAPGDVNKCENISGAIPQIVPLMDDEVDVVITGHTNWAVNCRIGSKVVTGAASQGRLITDIDLTVSRATKDVVGPISVNNRIVTQDVAKAEDITALIAGYNVFAGPIGARVIGATTAPILRAKDTDGESALGDVIADAQLAATVPAGAELALMNPGGIRADLPAGQVTYAQAFAVQPFSNIVVTMTLTGAQIERVLEQQFATADCVARSNVILEVSAGVHYEWSASAAPCDKVSNITLNGVPIDPAASYRVTVNSFLATGGDGFSVLNEGADRTFGVDDLVALESYFAGNSPVAPGPQDRITGLP